MDRVVEEAKRDGYVSTIFGRRRYLNDNLHGIPTVTVASTADSARRAASDKSIAGIGNAFAAQLYGARVAESGIEDHFGNQTSFETSRALAKAEGIPAGISSGAAVAAALEVGARPENAGKTIVVIIPSFAERYISSALFEGL